MKINNNSFKLNEKLSVIVDSSDNDGLIFIPTNIELNVEIENYFGKITINKIEISPAESEFQISKLSIESHVPNLDIKLLDRYIYKTLSDKNRFREWKLAPERGAIKDFFDTKIASSEPLYQLHLVPENAKDLDNLFVRLKAILNITDRKVSYLKRVIKKQKPWEPVIVSENLTWSEFSRINLFLHELEGVEPIVSVARTYPDNSSAHILGYVSQISKKDLQTKKYLKDQI